MFVDRMEEALKVVNLKKEEGNSFHKQQNYQQAIDKYGECVDLISGYMKDSSASKSLKETLAIILCNRAASYIKLNLLEDAKNDCTAVLEIDSTNKKAYYRRAQVYDLLGEVKPAYEDLAKLLHMDPKNVDGNALMRKIKIDLEKEKMNDSQVNRVLTTIMKGERVEDGLKALIGFCADEKHHAIDLIRKGGVKWLGQFIDESINQPSKLNLVNLAIKVLTAACSHQAFVLGAINIKENLDTSSSSHSNKQYKVEENGKLCFEGICGLLGHADAEVAKSVISLVIRCLKAWPPGVDAPPTQQVEEEIERPQVEELDDEKEDDEQKSSQQSEKKEEHKAQIPFLRKLPATAVIQGLLRGIKHTSEEVFTLSMDALASFLSEVEDYLNPDKTVDVRFESMSERKVRFAKQRLLKARSKLHSQWTLDLHALDLLLEYMDDESPHIRSQSETIFGKIVNGIDDDNDMKLKLKPYLYGHDLPVFKEGDPFPQIDKCRKRASLECSLFIARPELGTWALGENNGVQYLLLLIATSDSRCQEVASELLCLASSSESGSALLGNIVASGAIQALMISSDAHVRAAAASALTKLSIKAKALSENSEETTRTLNVVLDILKAAVNQHKSTKITKKDEKEAQLTSFSSLDNTAIKTDPHTLNQLVSKTQSSVERAVEVLAALAGRTFVKEELVHGSYRVAPSIDPLLKLEIDPRSTIGYGVAHILASITVTNRELLKKALADKDITEEQYKQMQELQRVKGKDDDGNEFEEKKEEEDLDTDELCKLRIQRIVSLNGIKCINSLLNHQSAKVKEAAARALRQMCVVESIRGQVIQEGALKHCCEVAVDDTLEKNIRREAAHVIAKTLVTTNPNILSEHLRLSTIRPLLFLCKDVDSTNLQQFEALMSLTNLTSCGQPEHDKFVAEKGISAVHYLMFSDHLMVRRAATETLCNLSNDEALHKLLRVPENLRLWLGLAEDYANEDNNEAMTTASAAAGTLAACCSDEGIAEAMMKENCVDALLSLLESGDEGLVHRAIYIVHELAQCGKSQVVKYLVEEGIVPALAVVKDFENPNLLDLVKETASLLSAAMKEADREDLEKTKSQQASESSKQASEAKASDPSSSETEID